MTQRQRQRDQDIEQDRHFELVSEAIADLGQVLGPVRLAKRDILGTDLPGRKRACARGHPQQQKQGRPDLLKTGSKP